MCPKDASEMANSQGYGQSASLEAVGSGSGTALFNQNFLSFFYNDFGNTIVKT